MGTQLESSRKYNILQSDAPSTTVKEAVKMQESYMNPNISNIDWTYVITFIVIIFLLIILIQARSQLSTANTTIQMLIAM